MAWILIVDDDLSLREVLEIALSRIGHHVSTAADTAGALDILAEKPTDLVLLDLRLGVESGVDLLRRIREGWKDLPVLMMTAYADPKTAVEVMKLGAGDYIAKPFDMNEFLALVEKTLNTGRIVQEAAWLKDRLKCGHPSIVGRSPKMAEVSGLIERIAPTVINVLITGESGTGKELIARDIHAKSKRRERPFIAINCGGLPENLIESELFGYRRGAFTGADRSKKGLLEMAEGGTVFLDEVAELDVSTQVKLLRYVQEKRFIPLGGTEEISSDVRILAATNRNVEEEVRDGRFREDLYYRLSGVIIRMPPLRERGDDVLLLADYFLKRACREQKRQLRGFTSEASAKLQSYQFPGNVRELENIIERAVALEPGQQVTPASLVIYEKLDAEPARTVGEEAVLSGRLSLDQYLNQEEASILTEALSRTGGHKGKAAELVGLNFRQFRYRLGKAGLEE